jgi:ketosteroid isomerase-like protein
MTFSRINCYTALAALASALSACITTSAPDTSQKQVESALAGMGAAANAHDVDRHVRFYARDSSTILIVNGEGITGWDAIRSKQREWWSDGKTDVIYTLQGRPDVRLLAPDLALTTLLMKSRRTTQSGTVQEGSFAVSAVWKKRPEGWKVIYSHESTAR